MIFVSTGGIKETTAYNTALTFIENGITGIELSGGAYEEIILSKYKKLLKAWTCYAPGKRSPLAIF